MEHCEANVIGKKRKKIKDIHTKASFNIILKVVMTDTVPTEVFVS